jgi:hypothetical protein
MNETGVPGSKQVSPDLDSWADLRFELIFPNSLYFIITKKLKI